ncbi:MAG: FliH/SctL family protein [Thermodesulfobacteriota bacterium]
MNSSKIYKLGYGETTSPLRLMTIVKEDRRDGACTASAERDGYEEGFMAGERAGMEMGLEKANLLLRRIAAMGDEIANFREKFYQENKEEFIKLVIGAASKVLHGEISINREVIANILTSAVDAMHFQEKAVIRVNPDDLSHLKENCIHIVKRLEEVKGFLLEEDSAIEVGGCVIESADGEVDARVEESLKIIEGAMREALKK